MSAGRRLNSWIGGFLDYTKHMGVDPLWRKWAAVSCISGALGRRAYIRTVRGTLYPNVFVLLVSPPGVGKSIIIDEIRTVWSAVDHLRVAPSSTTRAGLIDAMIDGKHIDTFGPVPEITSSLLCASVEFGNLVPAYDNAWLNILNELYDCGPVFQDRTRQHGLITIDNPHLVIIAGTQPKYLDNLLPDAAFGMGTTSRFIMVYSGEAQIVKMFSNVNRSAEMRRKLESDLEAIATLKGEFFPAPETEEMFHQLQVEKFAPQPEHPKLQHYCTRRPAHILKLMMILCAAEGGGLKILPSHLQAALDLLHETEKVMPQIFQEMVTKGYADANDEAWSYAMRSWLAGGRKPIPESKMISFLIGKVPNAHIKPTLETMVQAGQLRMEQLLVGSQTIRAYTPLPRADLK